MIMNYHKDYSGAVLSLNLQIIITKYYTWLYGGSKSAMQIL